MPSSLNAFLCYSACSITFGTHTLYNPLVLIPYRFHPLQMSKGQKARLTVPPELAYGDVGYSPIIPPKQTLVYEIELLSFANPDGRRA